GVDAKGCARNGCDAIIVEEIIDQIGVTGDRLARRRLETHQTRYVGIDIEGTLWPRTTNALGLIEHRHDEVPALLESAVALIEKALVAVERRCRCRLRY